MKPDLDKIEADFNACEDPVMFLTRIDLRKWIEYTRHIEQREHDLELAKQAHFDLIKDLRSQVASLTEKLHTLMVHSISFLARARENWEYLNPNNYDPNSLVWKDEEQLGKYLSELQKINGSEAGK